MMAVHSEGTCDASRCESDEKKRDPLRKAVHEPDKQEDTEEKLEDDGEPFDGNFA